MEKDIKKIIDKYNLISICQGDEGNIEILLLYKMEVTGEKRNKFLLDVIGVPYDIVNVIQGISKEELDRIYKLSKINNLRKEIEELEKELK